MTSFYIVGGDTLVLSTFLHEYGMKQESYEKADIIIFTGGADVDARYYNKSNHHSMWTNPKRDEIEVPFYQRAVQDDKKIFGICRGGQLAHVINGGLMHQNVDGHSLGGAIHRSFDIESNETVLTSSCHHQMMRFDKELGGQLVCTAARSSFRVSTDFSQRVIGRPHFDDDVEVIYYPHTKTICYQGHPEYGNPECTKYAHSLMKRFNFLEA